MIVMKYFQVKDLETEEVLEWEESRHYLLRARERVLHSHWSRAIKTVL